MTASAPCPCGHASARGRTLAYAACCAAYIDHGCPAPDALRLMRSRYSAFVLERADHLLRTWHPRTRPGSLDFSPGVKWLGLSVRTHRLIDADHAEVEFVARSRWGAKGQRLHETSRFLREDGRWFYVDGDLH